MTPFFLFFGLMVATGFIAHWSDNLGKKLGKKRVSLFGLRPKQTATLITVASSLLIMTVTFAAMLIVYKPLKEALFTFDKERAANRQLRADLTNLETRQKDLQDRSRKLTGVLASTNSELSRTQTNLTKARNAQNRAVAAEEKARKNERLAKQGERAAQSGRAQAQRGESAARRNEAAARRGEQNARNSERFARQRETSARRNEASARRDEATARRNQATAQRNLASAQRALKAAETRLANAREDLKKAQNAARVAQNAVRVTQTNLLKSRTELLKSRTELLAGLREVEESRVQVEQQQTKLAQLQSDIAQGQLQVANLQGEYKNLQAEYKNLQGEYKNAEDAVFLALTGPTLVSNRETLAVRTIPARLDSATISNLLRDLLLSARSNVKRLGEQNKRLGLELTVVPREVEIDGQMRKADEELHISILAQSLSGATPSSVRVVATRNHLVQEPDIEVAFDVVPIRPAYKRDEIIASAVIDGRRTGIGRNDGRTAAKIFNQLLNLVNEGQRLAENERKVEPPLGRDTQFYASDTNERIFDAIYDIQALGAPARVRLLAAEDLSTAAPLRVRFEVLPATATT